MENEFQPWSKQKNTRSFFSCKIEKTSQSSVKFNNYSVISTLFQKHLGVFLDGNLDFLEILTFKKCFKQV